MRLRFVGPIVVLLDFRRSSGLCSLPSSIVVFNRHHTRRIKGASANPKTEYNNSRRSMLIGTARMHRRAGNREIEVRPQFKSIRQMNLDPHPVN